jgi:molybdopterin converting factor small subunit
MSEPESTTYRVLLFASLKDAVGAGEIAVVAAPGCTVQELLRVCGEQFAVLAPWLAHVRVAVNCEYANVAQIVSPQDEIAVLPPVAGG